jgi:hypothetical protein
MPSQIKVDQITGSASSTVSIPSGTTLDLSVATIIYPSSATIKYVNRILLTASSGTYTKPSNLINAKVWCIAGGGGGGAADTGSNNGQSGVFGSITYKNYLFADLDSTESYTCGAAGTGGAAGANDGTAGGNTTFKGLTATGGAGGFYSNSGSRASAVTAAAGSGGDINYSSAFVGSTSNATESLVDNTAAGSATGLSLIFDGAILGNYFSTSSYGVATGAAGFSPVNGYGQSGGGADGTSAALAGGNGRPGCILIEEYLA